MQNQVLKGWALFCNSPCFKVCIFSLTVMLSAVLCSPKCPSFCSESWDFWSWWFHFLGLWSFFWYAVGSNVDIWASNVWTTHCVWCFSRFWCPQPWFLFPLKIPTDGSSILVLRIKFKAIVEAVNCWKWSREEVFNTRARSRDNILVPFVQVIDNRLRNTSSTR